MEKFISLNVEELAFKDSLQFLNSSLEKLVENLADKAIKSEGKLSLEQVFPNLYKYFQENWWHIPNPKKAFSMLTRKGVYPYSYMDSFGELFTHICIIQSVSISIYLDKFEETDLPDRKEFTNDLSKKEISDEDFKFIHDLYDTFNLQNLGQLHDLYMDTDVLLLADVIEGFRTWSMSVYMLDPAHFTTSPGLSWSACLRTTKQKLEIPTDPKMHLFFDRGQFNFLSLFFTI